ncbi:ribonuclease H-like domain-containing protein, partial [Mycena pura]
MENKGTISFPDGRRRRDLVAPRETELDIDLWNLMSEVMSEAELATSTYGALVHSDVHSRQVYVDGSCIGPQPARRAGAGIRWGMGSHLNRAFRVPGEQTNNRAELFSILGVLATTPPSIPLQFYTDSEYSINMIVHWGPIIAQTGWECINVWFFRHGDVLQAIQFQIRRRRGPIVFHHIRGHSGNNENEEADRLAKAGAS